MKSRLVFLFVLVCVVAIPMFAQVRPANELGVAAGHEHLRSANVEGARKFWLAIGGETAAIGMNQIVKSPACSSC